jgi:uncharacterized protein (TIGR02597 family)
MKSKYLLAFTALASAGFAFGQTASTNPVGYVTIECKANSDTIVGVPLRQSAAYAGSLNGAPDTVDPVPAGFAVLTLSGTPGLAVDAFADTHYVKFTNTTPTPAAGDGQWFVITANTADTLTVDLNGGSIAAVSGAGLEIIKFWTLAELFKPADSTILASTTGNAIVESTSQLIAGRRTQILIPNYAAVGTNASASDVYYENANIWKRVGDGATDKGAVQLWPDRYFIIRHPSTVTQSTFYTTTGEVEGDDMGIALATRAAGAQDSQISLVRPVDVTLNGLGLGGTSAFMSSDSQLVAGRKDQLLVFNNAIAGQNKSASTVYYYHAGLWKSVGGGATDRGTDVIPAGTGFIIRKYQTVSGVTAVWENPPSY